MNLQDPIELITLGVLSIDGPTRKQARAALAALPDPTVSAYFTTDKRSAHAVADPAKVAKLLAEYEALGLDGFALELAVLRAQREAGGRIEGAQFNGALLAALRRAGREPEVFEALADVEKVYLPSPKKKLWPGMSKLRALRYLRVPEGTLRAADHIAELADIPQRFELSLWVKDVNLSLWDAARENVSGLDLRGAYSNLSDAAPFAGWTSLTRLEIGGTSVSDASPLRALPLRHLSLAQTRVTDLTPLAAMTSLRRLNLMRLTHADLSPVWALTGIEHLDLSFTSARDLAPLRAFTKLRTLDLWGTPVASFEPLASLPLESLNANYIALPDLAPLAEIPTLRSLSIVGAPPDAKGLDALQRARPDVWISR
ncbi:MAG: hypothetical protein R3A52_27080 [Polyangiales bacterium]